MQSQDFFYRQIHLKDACREDIHYKVIDEETWQYLYARYGGN